MNGDGGKFLVGELNASAVTQRFARLARIQGDAGGPKTGLQRLLRVVLGTST